MQMSPYASLPDLYVLTAPAEGLPDSKISPQGSASASCRLRRNSPPQLWIESQSIIHGKQL